MGRSRTAAATIALLAVTVLGTGSPVAAQTTGGTVGATLTVADASACLTVTATAVSYLTALDFSAPGADAAAKSTPLYAIENCGTIPVDVAVRGTDATATDPAVATWALTGDPSFTATCATTDVYAVDVENTAGVGVFEMLTTTDQLAATLPAGSTATDISHDLWMPCEGSAGAGEQMSFDVLYTAVAAVVEEPAGEVVINEIQRRPAGDTLTGEWFEVHNPGGTTIDLHGMTILGQEQGETHVINASGGTLPVPAGGFVVLGASTNPADNGGVAVDYQYANIVLLDAGDFLELRDGGVLLDRVFWDGGTLFPQVVTGTSASLRDPALDNSVGSNWCTGPLTTPGSANSCP